MGTIGFGGNEALTGTFDGKGHTISNLTINQPGVDRVGLFRDIDGGTVRNLTLANIAVTGLGDAGSLAGSSDGADIYNVHVTSGTVTGAGDDSDTIGGLVGGSNATDYTDVTTT